MRFTARAAESVQPPKALYQRARINQHGHLPLRRYIDANLTRRSRYQPSGLRRGSVVQKEPEDFVFLR